MKESWWLILFFLLKTVINQSQNTINLPEETANQLKFITNTQHLHQTYLDKIINAPSSSYLGWSSWSLQASRAKGYGFHWLNETNVKNQVDVLATQFSQFGYDRVNLDSGWQDPNLDEYGREQLNIKKFPSGIHKFQSYLSSKGFKLGLYYLPGINSKAVHHQLSIKNTQYRADEIIQCPRTKWKGREIAEQVNLKKCKRPMANAFDAGYALNYSHPGSQMYINSLVDELYSWNVSFVKLDGQVPGSSFDPYDNVACDTRADLAAWRKAIDERYEQEWQYVGREKIWLVASWGIPTSEGPIMDRNTDSWRVEQDIEAYSTRMTTFDRVMRNVKTATFWTSIDQNRKWKGQIDLDSVLVSDMTYPESQSMVTVWAILGSPIYSGDDLTSLPQSRKSLLTNPEVLALARLAATNPARLDGFNLPANDPELNNNLNCQKLREQIWELQEKRRMVVELSLFEKLSTPPSIDYLNLRLSSCWDSLRSVEHTQFQSTNLPVNPHLNSPDWDDLWAVQFWVLELDLRDIFVAVVNAGQQLSSDEPVEVKLNLSQLEQIEKKMKHFGDQDHQNQQTEVKNLSTARNYLVRDLWKRENIGVVGLYSTFKFTLGVHDSKLLKFSLI